MSGPRIGPRGKTKDRSGKKHHNGQLIKKMTTDELRSKVESSGGSGKDRHKCRMELERRERAVSFLDS
jgi:hypothetical protein